MNYYPMMVNLKGKRCVVVGGGRVAERKVAALVTCEAEITVVSPEITNTIQHWAIEGKIKWLKREFEPTDLKEAVIVIAATNISRVNLDVYTSIQPNQWINIVDRPDLCTFIVPASVRKGDLIVSISTHGNFPGLSKSLRKEINEWLGDDYEAYLTFLSQMRTKVKALPVDSMSKRKILQSLLAESFREWTKNKQFTEREQAVEQLINSYSKNVREGSL